MTFKIIAGALGQQVVFRIDEDGVSVSTSGGRAFVAPAADSKLLAEAQRIQVTGLVDPMLAAATSDVQSLPHQICAAYGALLHRAALRYLLAIRAQARPPSPGSTPKSHPVRGRLPVSGRRARRAGGAVAGRVEFQVRAEVRTTHHQLIDNAINLDPVEGHPLLIARMDQLSRNEQIQAQLGQTGRGTSVMVDEAHRMDAHYLGNKVGQAKRFPIGELSGQYRPQSMLMTATPPSGMEEVNVTP